MFELINIILNIYNFYRLTLSFEYYGIPSERIYYITFFGKPIIINKYRIVINYNCIKDIIKYV